MRPFASVPSTVWQAEVKKLRGDLDAIAVFFHLLTSQHSSMIGVYPLAIGYMAHDLGIPFEGASKGLRRVCEAGLATYDEESELVWIHDMAASQIAPRLSPKDNKVAAVAKQLELLPICPITLSFYARYRELYHLRDHPLMLDFERAFLGASEALRSKEKDKEQEKDPGPERGISGSGRKEDTYPHARANDEPEMPYDPPPSLEEGKAMIRSLGVPARHFEQALTRLMMQALFPCDVKTWKAEAADEAA
ncbi:hypothetical protein B5K03_08825 [Rhizobium phaseoli]|uniref:hypothetical protein n=1 Tax=Rhizobium phaseoli TaxID=396 RepID=UPI000D681B38|nr:hypothetical protein [Rhizobium phaseoli]PWI54813.1 hypothetical protein B5K03_08825 [Rhizobium phaseoli]